MLTACREPVAEGPARRIELSVLEDKIRGGWAGQMIGVSYGAPTEFQYLGELVPEEKLVDWQPGMVAGALDQDDLYVDITLAGVLDEHGLDATTDEFAAAFREAPYALWHGNLAARRALRRGIPAPASGSLEYNVHANDIDFQIEADFIGLMAPGMPNAASDLCRRAGGVMSSGDGLSGGVFVSAMYSAAFFENDPKRIVEAGLAVLPPESRYARVVGDVLTWARESPNDWTKVWRRLDEKWNRDEACPEGALRPFNIDAALNGAHVALGLLYGDGDFEETMRVATRAGQDSDCNPATAAGILGVMLGYSAIPAEFTSGIEAIADERFSYTDATFRSIVDDTVRRAVEMIERGGGRREGRTLVVETQEPVPASIDEADDFGVPTERIAFDDSRWSWSGDWGDRKIEKWGTTFSSWSSEATGSEASIRFVGTGAVLTGWYLPTGGLADVYLDGVHAGTVDTYPDEDDVKIDDAVWHEFDLADGDHEIRLVVRGEPYPESRGAEICLTGLVVYRR
jgi:hypothetical protein